jgi:hypothetical protein
MIDPRASGFVPEIGKKFRARRIEDGGSHGSEVNAVTEERQMRGFFASLRMTPAYDGVDPPIP